MRKMLYMFCLLMLTTPALAQAIAEVRCYNGGKNIYHGYAEDIVFEEGIYAFKDNRTKKIVFIDADCVVKFSI